MYPVQLLLCHIWDVRLITDGCYRVVRVELMHDLVVIVRTPVILFIHHALHDKVRRGPHHNSSLYLRTYPS